MLVNTRISGIPATLDVHRATYTAPNHRADSDWDYYGGWTIEYTICDSKGRPAPWLEAKVNSKDLAELEGQIIEAMSVAEEDY